MTPKQIEKNVNRLDDEGIDASRVALLVEFKRGAQDRDQIVENIARGRGESKASVAKMLKGWKPAILIRAGAADSRLGDGDLCLTDGSSYEHSGEIGYWRPDELAWGTAQVIGEYGETVGEPDYETLYQQAENLGGRGGRSRYY
jgi:hypothetical protein